MSDILLRDAAMKKRASMSPASRKHTYNQKRTWKYPIKIERILQQKLTSIFDSFTHRVLLFVAAKNPEYERTVDGVRHDSLESDILPFLATLRGFVTENVSTATTEFSAKGVASKIFAFLKNYTEKEVTDYFMKVTGSPLAMTNLWWDDIKSAWVDTLVGRINKNVGGYFDAAQALVVSAIQNKTPHSVLISQISDLNTSLTSGRAEFLARDLTGTLKSTMDRNVQTGMGFFYYTWNTRGDERVRGRPGGRYPDAIPSHWMMHDALCSWNDPTVYSLDRGKTWIPKPVSAPQLHPGEDWGCRCNATPFDLDFLRELDQAIAMREAANGEAK